MLMCVIAATVGDAVVGMSVDMGSSSVPWLQPPPACPVMTREDPGSEILSNIGLSAARAEANILSQSAKITTTKYRAASSHQKTVE